MSVRLNRLVLLIALAFPSFGPVCAQSSDVTSRVWVTAMSVPIQQSGWNTRWAGIRIDAPAQWKADASWQTVASHVKVGKLIAGNVENTSAADLHEVIEEIKRRHMELGLEIGPLVRSDSCNAKSEAYGRAGETEAILGKIRAAGGDLSYLAMDEPFYFGHSDMSGCHLSAADLARQVAASVASMRRIFPKLQVGDIEVAGADREWMAELAQWADAYRAALNEPLAFFHADVAWSDLAMRNLVTLDAEMKRRHIPFGVIYNASDDVTTDLEWTESATRHFIEIESILKVHPEDAIFQSWTKYPTHVLPEDQPGTLMSVALSYVRPISSLRLSRSANDISGVLTGPGGEPIRGASVNVTAVDVGGRLGPLPRRLEGVVPAGAVTGVVGIRAGNEGSCICAGTTGAIVGGIHYREKGTGKPPQDVSPVNVPIQGSPPSVRTLDLVPGKVFAPNLKQFPVSAGAPYTLDTAIAATAAAERAGYVTIVFLDGSGKGIRRDNIWFTPSSQSVGTARTDDHGSFRLQMPPAIVLAQPKIRAEYSGSATVRPAVGILASPLGEVNASLPALKPPLFGSSSPLTMLFMRSDVLPVFAADPPVPSAKEPWDQAARRIQVAYFSAGEILKTPDESLARMVRDFEARRIGLGVEILATNWFHEPPCGQGVEGFIDPGSANQVVTKLLKAGATLEQVGMDEPLWFGHFYTGKNACQSSLAELANRVAVIVKIYTAAFPNVLVGDVEPFPAVSNKPNWEVAYASWVKAFHSATGTSLSFLRLDFNWGDSSLSADHQHNTPDPVHIANLARQVNAVARQNGLLTDMIMNGGGAPIARSDEEWMQQARMHIRALQAPGIRFDHVLFESWDKFPARTLPMSDPNALGSLVPFYAQGGAR